MCNKQLSFESALYVHHDLYRNMKAPRLKNNKFRHETAKDKLKDIKITVKKACKMKWSKVYSPHRNFIKTRKKVTKLFCFEISPSQ